MKYPGEIFWGNGVEYGDFWRIKYDSNGVITNIEDLGKNKSRPFLILRKINKDISLACPSTTQPQGHYFNKLYLFKNINGENFYFNPKTAIIISDRNLKKMHGNIKNIPRFKMIVERAIEFIKHHEQRWRVFLILNNYDCYKQLSKSQIKRLIYKKQFNQIEYLNSKNMSIINERRKLINMRELYLKQK